MRCPCVGAGNPLAIEEAKLCKPVLLPKSFSVTAADVLRSSLRVPLQRHLSGSRLGRDYILLHLVELLSQFERFTAVWTANVTRYSYSLCKPSANWYQRSNTIEQAALVAPLARLSSFQARFVGSCLLLLKLLEFLADGVKTGDSALQFPPKAPPLWSFSKWPFLSGHSL